MLNLQSRLLSNTRWAKDEAVLMPAVEVSTGSMGFGFSGWGSGLLLLIVVVELSSICIYTIC